MADHLVTLQEAADELGVHYMTAYRYVRTGRLPAVKQGVEWRVDPADLVELQVGRRAPSPSGGRPAASRWTAEPDRLARRLTEGDEPGAWQLVEDALTAGATAEAVYTHLLVPAMADVGDRWGVGDATIADEHTATVTMQRLVGRLGPRFNRPGRKRGTIVLGAAPGDLHGLSVGLLADPLRGRGFHVLDLGANVPLEAWQDAVRGSERLRVTGVSVISPGLDAAVVETVATIHQTVDVPVVIGGGGITDEAHARALGADAWAPSQAAALDLFEALARA